MILNKCTSVGSYYRQIKAIRDGRPTGRKGRPPLLEPMALPLLFMRVRQRILMKEQITSAVLLEIVLLFLCFLFSIR
jgi:hypothetical protein